MLLFSKSRSLSSRRKIRVVISFVSPRDSQHIVGLWKKEIQRVSKNKSNSLSGRKGFFHNNAGNGKTLRAKQNRVGVQIFFEATKKNTAIGKTTSIIRHSVFFNRKVRRCGKNRLNTSTFLAGSKTQHLPRVKLSLFSKHPFGGFYR